MYVIPRNRLKREFFPKGTTHNLFGYAVGELYGGCYDFSILYHTRVLAT